MTFMTDTGRTITARDRATAEALAKEYGLGRIVGKAPAPPRKGQTAARWVAWHTLTETPGHEGTLTEVVRWILGGREREYTLLARGPRGLRAPTAAERRAIRQTMAEVAE